MADRKRQTQRQVDVLAAEHVPYAVLLSSTGAQQRGVFESWGAVVPAVKGDGGLVREVAPAPC